MINRSAFLLPFTLAVFIASSNAIEEPCIANSDTGKAHSAEHINTANSGAIASNGGAAGSGAAANDGGVSSSGNVSAPSISLDKNVFDFGSVEEGFPVSHTFTIGNQGHGALRLRVSATCGCTTPKLPRNELQPGETEPLEITVDTSMKQDAVTKEVIVESNDPLHPRLTIDLKMVVQDPHRAMGKDDATKIFTDQHCASCHVARGEGKVGRELYNADCAMCHGPKAEGAVGPALFGPYKNEEFAHFMKTVLEEGSKKHRSMPGFSAEHGGPLSKNQVDSLLQYLAGISSARGL